jgi:lysophospholipid acyltransferase (LPLAT)-like uncharacterized protein
MAATPVSLLHRLVGFIGCVYLRLVGKTSFIHRLDHPRSLEYRRKKKPAIYAFWHNNQVFLAYDHRNEPVSIMVSKSADGEYIAQVMKWMGLGAVRGSTSRNGTGALREMCQLLKKGRQVGFTPDGPKGPAQTVHGGLIAAARMSGCPIIPTAVAATRKLTFNSWDKFFVPLPFGSVVVAHGEPFYLPRNKSHADSEKEVREALNGIATLAQQEATQIPSWFQSFFT